MLTYKSLELTEDPSEKSSSNITLTKIENMKKILKSHRAGLDFDKNFIFKSITVDDFNFKEEVENCDGKKKGGPKKRQRKS